MRRRTVNVIMASAVVLGMSMSLQSLAAPSVTGGTIDQNQVTAVTVPREQLEAEASGEETSGQEGSISVAETGTPVNVIVFDQELDQRSYPEEIRKLIEAVDEARPETSVAALLAEAYEGVPEGLPDLDVYDTKSIYEEEKDGLELLQELTFLTEIASISFENVEPTEEEPVEVTFTVNNATDRMEIYVLNYCDEHGWELLETEINEENPNQLTARFHAKASLIAFVYREKEDETILPEEGVGVAPGEETEGAPGEEE